MILCQSLKAKPMNDALTKSSLCNQHNHVVTIFLDCTISSARLWWDCVFGYPSHPRIKLPAYEKLAYYKGGISLVC